MRAAIWKRVQQITKIGNFILVLVALCWLETSCLDRIGKHFEEDGRRDTICADVLKQHKEPRP